MATVSWTVYSVRLLRTADRMSRARSAGELKAVIAENEDLWHSLDKILATGDARHSQAAEKLRDRARYVVAASHRPQPLSDSQIASFIALNRQAADMLSALS